MSDKFSIPKEVTRVTETLEMAGFEAFLVGGCVRDIILGRTPKDWDVTTNAKPDQIIALFPKTFYENTFGTVGVVSENDFNESILRQSASSLRESTTTTPMVVEVTPYRLESEYSDNRHPDQVTFSKNIEDDLKRRDFTINAMAYSVSRETITDMFHGKQDLENKVIRTVGNPLERFSEDALRILRAVRFHVELGFEIELETEKAMFELGHLLVNISHERIRDEFSKMLMSDHPMEGMQTLRKLNLLSYIAPELEKTIGVEQNKAHAYDVWEHLLRSLQHAADQKLNLDMRLAALFHDISKPETRRWGKDTWTFYGHEVVGARVTKKILNELKYPSKTVDKGVTMVRWHMFFSDTEQITLSAVRRMIANVGETNIWDLMDLRICDRIGTGRPKANPYRLRKYRAMVEEALRDPVSVGMLKIDGKRLMDVTRVTPGPKIGYTLHALLDEVLDDPKKNTEEYLEKRAGELIQLPENELKALGDKGRQSKEEIDEEEIKKIREKHWVK